MNLTDYHAKYSAYELTKRCASDKRGSVWKKAVEVFHHATATFLCGCLRPRNVKKHDWQIAILHREKVDTISKDQIDAASAALTGLYTLNGRFRAIGDPNEGVIVVSCESSPPEI